MNISIIGIWHLGSVTSACLANFGHNILCVDDDKNLIKKLKNNVLPIYEPGLAEMTKKYYSSGKINYSHNFSDISQSEIVWICYDTPVDENDNANVEFVINKINKAILSMKKNTNIIISSQIPIGTTNRIKIQNENLIKKNNLSFAYIPENLRLGNSLRIFKNPDRVIVGIDSKNSKKIINQVYGKIRNRIIWMSVESAEMTKHAINSFLACSVVFINELASICEVSGADAMEVEKGLKSEKRIGPYAYLKPGTAFAGGTLARDIKFLINKGKDLKIEPVLFEAILKSNNNHKDWIKNKINLISKNNRIKKITVLGLTYKPGTSTLRRSLSVELCNWLILNNFEIKVYDPMVEERPNEINGKFEFYNNIDDNLFESDILIVSNECKEYLDIDFKKIHEKNPKIKIVDPNAFLKKSNKNYLYNFKYYNIGKSS